MSCPAVFLFFDFLFDSAVTTAFYTLSLHDALPICSASRALVEAGLTEVTSSPFIAESVFDRLRYEVADERRSAVRLLNPLADDEPLMRTEMLQTLLPTARRNLGR